MRQFVKNNLIFLLILALGLFVVSLSPVYGQSYWTGYSSQDAGRALGGEHTPLVWSGTVTLPASSVAEQTTSWMQFGYSPSASMGSGSLPVHVNPENFTLSVLLSTTGDSVVLAAARFELADSSSGVGSPFWNADSTNLFVADGNYTHTFYGTWMFEDIPAATEASVGNRTWLYPLRVIRGSHIRFVFTGSAAQEDATTLNWTLWGEN